MSELKQQHCLPCKGETRPLERPVAETLMTQVPGWSLNAEVTAIRRTFEFKNFHETMAFVNAVAWIAHREDHHPELEVGYKRCHVRYSTHNINGLSNNDFICAAKVNGLVE
jgi:4a-hydroxytetrahydrobiopterin dehydratase